MPIRASVVLMVLLLLPIAVGSAGGELIIYYDERYPSNWVEPEPFLKYLRRIMGEFRVPYRVLNADELRDFMMSGNGIVVFMSDIAPDTLWDCSDDAIILSWIKRGGVLVWTGDWELYYAGHANGSMRYCGTDKLLGKRITSAVDEGVAVRPTEAGAKYIPSLKRFLSMRPFDAGELAGLDYEAYGIAELNGRRFLDPCAVRVGRGLFVKVSATLGESFGFLYVAELILNRFYGMGVRLTADPSGTFIPYAGIVYILPSGVSSPHWQRSFGDRIYFYVKSDLRSYETHLRRDLALISSRYNFVILVVPLSDSPLFRRNARLLDDIASSSGMGVLYAIFPKADYGPEEDYLKPGSRVNEVLVSTMRFLSKLSSTVGVAVWYGWRDRGMDPEELRRFYSSLPEDVRSSIWLWLDEGFVEEVLNSGIIEAADHLNLTLITELYSPSMLASYCDLAKKQMIVTGYWNASSSDEWLNGMRRKLELVRGSGKILGVWIFWDENDGFGEAYRAYIGGELRSPIARSLSFDLIDASSEVDRAIASSLFPSAIIAPGANLVVGGPLANRRSGVVERYGVKFTRDELILNGIHYRSSWGRSDYGLILYMEGKVYVMGTHRYGTEAALLWLRTNGFTGNSSLVEWRDLNGNGRVEVSEVSLSEWLPLPRERGPED